MVTEVQTYQDSDPEGWETLHGMCMATYLDGECYAFAIALHRNLGWPLVGIMLNGVVRHALVEEPDGSLRDVRGKVARWEAGRPFGMAECDFRRIEESDLFNQRPIHDRAIEHARLQAETLWPELPWKQPDVDRMHAFTDELEALCRKHGVWVWGGIPAQQPLVSPSDELFQGYRLKPTIHGYTFILERRLGR